MRTRARQRVLEYVSQHPGALASQVARGLGMSSPAVRYHLTLLKSDGRIGLVPSEARGSRGRPGLRYRLSDRLSGDNLAMLAAALLQLWEIDPADGAGKAVVTALAGALIEQLAHPAVHTAAPRRLASLVDRLSQLHYSAHWEAGAEGPRVIFGHCPYAAVIEAHPELCEMDRLAISRIMGAEADQRAKINPKSGSPSHCVFSLR